MDEFCVDHNATQAAIRAGYSAKTAHQIGYELLRKPEIGKMVRERLAQSAGNLVVTKQFLTDHIGAAFLSAVGERNFTAISSLGQLLGKLHGHIIEKRQNLRDIGGLEDLTDDELTKLSLEAAKRERDREAEGATKH